jgi:hypothetical protein
MVLIPLPGLGESMAVTQSLVGLNPKNSSLCLIDKDQLDMVKAL